MFFYGPLVAQVILSLNYDILIAYATSRKGLEEVKFSKSTMDFGMQWFILFISAIPIFINFFFVALSGVYALSSVLSQLQSATFDNNHLTQGLEIMIGAVVALAFQIPQFIEAYFYSAYLEAYLGP